MLSYSNAAMQRAMKVQEVISRAKAKKITGWEAAEKWRRDGLWKRRWVEKSKNDFSTQLGNPANPAGFPLSHSPGDCGRLTKTGHFICYEKGTFLMS
jgi:hypothetical protein